MKNKIIIIGLLISLYQKSVSQDFELIPYRIDNKWGYSDASKNIIIDIKYDNVTPFNSGVAAYKLDNKWGILDIKGTEIIPPLYDSISGYFETYSFYDKNYNEIYETAIGVYTGNKLSYLNKKGELLNGLEEMSFMDDDFDYGNDKRGLRTKVYKENNLFGLINKKTKDILIEAKYDSLIMYMNNSGSFRSENGKFIKIPSYYLANKKGKWGIITETDDIVVPFEYDEIKFQKGIGGIYKKKGKYGAFDSNFKVCLDNIYDKIIFKNGLYIVYKRKKAGVLSYKNKIVIPLMYSKIEWTKDNKGFYVTDKKNKTGYCKSDGTLIIQPKYKDLKKYYYINAFSYKENGLEGYINEKGEVLINAKYKKIYPFKNKYALVITQKNKKGYINEKGIEFFE